MFEKGKNIFITVYMLFSSKTTEWPMFEKELFIGLPCMSFVNLPVLIGVYFPILGGGGGGGVGDLVV